MISYRKLFFVAVIVISAVLVLGYYDGASAQTTAQGTMSNDLTITKFDLNPKLVCDYPYNPARLDMALEFTIDANKVRAGCGGDIVQWCIARDVQGIDYCVYPSQGTNNSYMLRSVGPQIYSENLSSNITVDLQTSLLVQSGYNLYAVFVCPGVTLFGIIPPGAESSRVNIKYDPNATGASCGGTTQPPVQGGTTKIYNWSIPNALRGLSSGAQPTNVFDVLILISDWILNIAGALIVLLIIYSGVRFMISRGNPGEIQRAKNILKWALIGFAVILIGKGFIFLIEAVLT